MWSSNSAKFILKQLKLGMTQALSHLCMHYLPLAKDGSQERKINSNGTGHIRDGVQVKHYFINPLSVSASSYVSPDRHNSKVASWQ